MEKMSFGLSGSGEGKTQFFPTVTANLEPAAMQAMPRQSLFE